MQLSKSDASIAIAALLAVSASGGGSSTYTLARKIAAAAKIDLAEIAPEYVVTLQSIATREYLDGGDAQNDLAAEMEYDAELSALGL